MKNKPISFDSWIFLFYFTRILVFISWWCVFFPIYLKIINTNFNFFYASIFFIIFSLFVSLIFVQIIALLLIYFIKWSSVYKYIISEINAVSDKSANSSIWKIRYTERLYSLFIKYYNCDSLEKFEKQRKQQIKRNIKLISISFLVVVILIIFNYFWIILPDSWY